MIRDVTEGSFHLKKKKKEKHPIESKTLIFFNLFCNSMKLLEIVYQDEIIVPYFRYYLYFKSCYCQFLLFIRNLFIFNSPYLAAKSCVLHIHVHMLMII